MVAPIREEVIKYHHDGWKGNKNTLIIRSKPDYTLELIFDDPTDYERTKWMIRKAFTGMKGD